MGSFFGWFAFVQVRCEGIGELSSFQPNSGMKLVGTGSTAGSLDVAHIGHWTFQGVGEQPFQLEESHPWTFPSPRSNSELPQRNMGIFDCHGMFDVFWRSCDVHSCH